MSTMQNAIYIGIGSNLGNRMENLQNAINTAENDNIFKVLHKSSIYETSPLGWSGPGPDFYNAVVEVTSGLGPHELMERLQGIEKAMGRDQAPRNAPRVIDLDILFYGDELVDLPDLKIPHPRIREREFVLVPLCEIAQAFVLPMLGKSACELLEALGPYREGRVLRRMPWPD